MYRPILLTVEQSMDATKGDIVVDADSRSLHIKISDCDCRSSCPSPYNNSPINCCWMSLRHLDMVSTLEQRLRSGDAALFQHIPLSNHPDIRLLRDRDDINADNLQAQLNDLSEQLARLKQQCAEQLATIQRLTPSSVATIEDGERKLQLQPQ